MITAEQREQRRMFIGSSDVAAVLGMDPFRSVSDVYWSKVAGIDSDESDAMRVGNALESVILDWAEEQLGERVERNVFLQCDDPPYLAVNLDGITRSREIVEAKSHGICSPADWSAWGETGTDEVPDSVLCQVQHQLFVAKSEVAHVAALVGGRGFRMHRVERSEKLIGIILAECEKFWAKNVQAAIPPDEAPSLGVIRKLPRRKGKKAAVPDYRMRAFIEARRAESVAKKERERFQSLLLQAMGDAEYAESDSGCARRVTVKRKAYSVEAGEYTMLDVKEA